MFTDATTSVVTQGNSKSTIQSLLRCKEPCHIKSVPVNCDQDNKIWNYPAVSDFEGVTQHPDSELKHQTSPVHVFNNENSQDSLDQQKDFNYSQKLFHIADGNLYSIFSPIQGRSYGMKPSFLRKQKYTVQESHSRGRKNLRKGLKFHNFLPSESVTSEKDSGYANAKWKVYSECRLREEHGTKQIAISNWSQSVQNPPDDTSTFTNGTSVPDLQAPSKTISAKSTSLLPNDNQNELISESEPATNDTRDLSLNSQLYTHEQNIFQINQNSKAKNLQKSFSSHSSKKDSLNILLNSLTQKPLISEKSNYLDDSDSQNRCFQKHRRKPVQTRRIVPYNKYLSILEENETLPLDLSSKCLIESSSNASGSSDCGQNSSEKSDFDFPISNISSTVSDKNAKNLTSNYMFENKSYTLPKASSDKLLHKEVSSEDSNPVALLYPFPVNKNFNLSEQNSPYPPPPPLLGLNSSVIEDKQKHNLQAVAASRSSSAVNQFLNPTQFSIQKSVVKEVQSKPRRRNQRSVMKQKLEDTFRQNGFLVKTKQVSDGEATFCKFRQLRKCTRYYLKSLEQHLPDEFHKMLKGFLPPKTVLPPVLGAPSPASET